MTDLQSALDILDFGARSVHSTDLSPEQCAALREYIEELESRVATPVEGEVAL